MGMYRHRMPDREIQMTKALAHEEAAQLDAERNNVVELRSETLTAAQYWEAQASMWHENYKEAIRHEEEARRYKDALLRIKGGGYGTKERVRQIIKRALMEDE